jgi:hypothetical protein
MAGRRIKLSQGSCAGVAGAVPVFRALLIRKQARPAGWLSLTSAAGAWMILTGLNSQSVTNAFSTSLKVLNHIKNEVLL